jgi:SAM-dependent methyltransferase
VLERVRRRLGLDGGRSTLSSTQQTWEQLAQRDPLWAVLTDPRKAGRGWDPGDFFATGELEIERVLAYLAGKGIAPARGIALDFGCGVGRLTRALARRMDEVDGVDASPTMIERARELNAGATGRMRFVLNQEPHLGQLPSARYAFIYSSIVLQHMPAPSALGYVREFFRLAGPGGLVVFQAATRVRRSVLVRLRAQARRLAHRLHLVGDDLRIEMHALAEAEILRHASGAGFDVLDVVSTNATAADANGALEFFTEDRGEPLVSRQFALRRR